jgi:hypothetical protein
LNAALLQTQLQLPYRRASWFSAAGLLPQLLPGRVELFAQPVVFALVTEAEQAVATGFCQLGRVFLPAAAPGGPERIVALHEITVAANIDLLRNRVGLRRLVARGIDEVSAHAVLAFFVQPGETAWRLTYAARESVMNEATLAIERRETAARRFTFVLGPGESRRTAALRLAGLANARIRPAASLDELNAAFAVESLNNEFFELYRAHYTAFCTHLIGTDAPTRLFGVAAADLAQPDEKLRDRALKPVRDFVKKLLGRIVFLHFLQKKGWLGCPADRTDWAHGDGQFLAHLFASAPDADRFHSARLVPLFYETLNRPDRPGDRFTVTGTRVPYLNGGLFERDFTGVDQVDFSGGLFARLFEFLGSYHFTIDENDPEDHEIGIDPEMLGHIFENLLEDNKDKGAYYTPKAVVHYMARQSLAHALAARYPGDAAAPAEIAAFLRLKEPPDPRADTWLSRHATGLAAHLGDLRICDPAIGSGAFPIGLLHEIYWAQLALNPSLPRAAAKRAIIQNSIHGVDLDAGAVEIARLRFWLALVVDEAVPSPLPNLDYQIMQGNSLLESFEGEPLDDLAEPVRYGIRRLGSDQHEFDLGAAQTEIVEVATPPQERLAALRAAYFRCHDPVEKGRLRGEIDAAVLQAIDARLARRADELDISLQSEAALVRGRGRTAKETKHRAAMEAELAALAGKTARLHALLADPRAERPFFLWHLWFRHVLADAPDGRGGFDIVIANPPYGAEMSEAEVSQVRAKYDTIANSFDSFIPFTELATQLLNLGGCLAYIIPSGWVSTPSCGKLRLFFSQKFRPQVFVSLPYDVFGEAYVDTSIVVASRLADGSNWSLELNRTLPLIVFPVRYRVGDQDDFLKFEKEGDFGFWTDPSENGFLITASRNEAALVRKIRMQAASFEDFLDVMRGIETFNPSSMAASEFARAALTGDIYRYELREGPPGFVDYPASIEGSKPWRFFGGPRVLLRQLLSRRFRLQATFTDVAFLTNQSVQSLVAKDGFDGLLKPILAVLNSQLISWFFCQINMVARRDDFPKTIIQVTRRLPLPCAADLFAATPTLTALVDQILGAKRAGDAAAVARLEAEIDAHVYRLYGLTAPEIALVEGAAAPVAR